LIDALTKQFDKLEKQDLWGNRGLSYPIAHQTAAFYAHFEFQSEPQNISNLDKNLKLNEDVLRFLLTKKEDKKIRVKKGKKVVEAKPESELEKKDEEVLESEGQEDNKE
jgi:small subunit ribosomal protein S6